MSSRSSHALRIIDRCRLFSYTCRFQYRNKLRQGNVLDYIGGFSIYSSCHLLLTKKGKTVQVYGISCKQFCDLCGVRLLSAMASCGYTKYVGGDCGASPERPDNDQVVRIADCCKDIKGHLKTCGVSESALNSEARLLLARAGKVQN